MVVGLTGVVLLAATTCRPWVNFSDSYTQNVLHEAWVANDRGNQRDAERLLRMAIDHDGGNVQAWTLLGHVLMGQDRDEELGRCCDRALELDAKDPGVRSLVGWWRESCAGEARQQDDLATAARLYTEAVELDNTRPGAWTGLGLVREELGELEAARAAYLRAVQLDASAVTANERLGALSK